VSVRALLAIAAAGVLSACATSRWGPLDQLPAPPANPEAPAEVVLDEHFVDYHLESGRAVADERTHRVFRALRPDSKLPEELVVQYHRSFSEVLLVQARIVLPDGTSRDVEEPRVDVPYISKFELYQEGRLVKVRLPPVPVGGVLETVAVVRWREPRLLPQRAALSSPWPVRSTRVQVSAPPDWAVEWEATELGAPLDWKPAEDHQKDRVVRVWESRDLPAFVPETNGPPIEDGGRFLDVRLARWTESGKEVRSFRDAKDLSAWDFELSRPSSLPSDAMRQWVAKVVEEEHADSQRVARRLYDFASNEVQYCAIELGMGGWQPHTAQDVFSVRYGDCKDKANLLRTMLKLAGIESEPVLLFSHHGWPHRFAITRQVTNFNHQILSVRLPSGPVLVDPTSRTVPFGDLPFSDCEAPMLPVAAEGRELEQSPPSPAGANEETLRLHLNPRDDGTARGPVALTAKGAPASLLREKLAEAQRTGRTSSDVLREWLSIPTDAIEVAPLNPAGKGPLQVDGTLTERVLKVGGGTWVLRPAEILKQGVPSLPDRPRRSPYVRPYRTTERVSLELSLPEGAAAPSLPPPFDLDSEFGSYRLAWSKDGSTLKLERAMVWKEHLVPATRYADFKRFCDAALGAEAVPAVIHVR
jgi:transglutaminase-like putative cysteine protease